MKNNKMAFLLLIMFWSFNVLSGSSPDFCGVGVTDPAAILPLPTSPQRPPSVTTSNARENHSYPATLSEGAGRFPSTSGPILGVHPLSMMRRSASDCGIGGGLSALATEPLDLSSSFDFGRLPRRGATQPPEGLSHANPAFPKDFGPVRLEPPHRISEVFFTGALDRSSPQDSLAEEAPSASKLVAGRLSDASGSTGAGSSLTLPPPAILCPIHRAPSHSSLYGSPYTGSPLHIIRNDSNDSLAAMWRDYPPVSPTKSHTRSPYLPMSPKRYL